MMKSPYAIAALFFGLVLSAFSQPAPTIPDPALTDRVRARYGLSAEQAEELKTKGEITRFQDKNFTSLLLPDKALAETIGAQMRALEPTVLVEALFVVPVNPETAEKDGFDLHVYNTLRSVGTMKGIEYYSASRGRMRIMFHDAYVVKDPESRKALPDPLEKKILPESLVYIYQHDSSFGRNTYETKYFHRPPAFRVSMTNLTVMYYTILPLVQPENLRLELVVLPGEDHLLFYGCIGVKTYGLFGLEKKVHDSFYNRIKALYGWFSREFKQF